MARVDIGLSPQTPGWDGRTGLGVAPQMAYLLRDLGVPVFKREASPRNVRGLPEEWVREEVRSNDAGAWKWFWCAPVPVAILARVSYEKGSLKRQQIPRHDSSLAQVVWAVGKVGLKALDSLYRLSDDAGGYIDQVHTMYEQRNDGDK